MVVTPVYSSNLSRLERLSLNNTLLLTKPYEHIFIGPEFVKGYFKNLYPKSDFLVLPKSNFKSIRSYNRLMLSPWFYKLFSNYSHILICQLDVCLMKQLNLNGLLKYDYVGAPCTFGLGNKAYVGNGGFSLRKVSSFIDVLENGFKSVSIKWKECVTNKQIARYFFNLLKLHRFYIVMGFINEDLIVSLYLKKPLVVPDLNVSAEFCQDALVCETVNPTAYHGWEKNLAMDMKQRCLKTIKN